jgi:hypothetical protein
MYLIATGAGGGVGRPFGRRPHHGDWRFDTLISVLSAVDARGEPVDLERQLGLRRPVVESRAVAKPAVNGSRGTRSARLDLSS